MSDYTLIVGDCVEAMRLMQPDSVDAVVTDPPYGLSFMGKRWDYDVPGFATWRECLRVLRPGGRLLAFAGTRTMHRMWVNIEDAGFAIEDTIAWMYGSGFPKHRSKLKPAYEPICIARKGPVSELNIDDCRIVAGERPLIASTPKNGALVGEFRLGSASAGTTDAGRWPANVMLDEEAARLLDEQSGELTSGAWREGMPQASTAGVAKGVEAARSRPARVPDSGGASRFFYVSKASRAERNAGLEGQPGRTVQRYAEQGQGPSPQQTPRTPLVESNHHPTVKPVDLMRYLVRLVTPAGGIVLDPFAGSGTTGVACILEGREFIGCELSEEYAEIARRRIGNTQPSLFGGAA